MKLIEVLQHRARTEPQGLAIIDGQRTICVEQLWQLVDQTADFLHQHCVDRLAINIDNELAWIVLDLSAQLNQMTVVPLPTFFTQQQKQHAIRESGAAFLIEKTNIHSQDLFVDTLAILDVTLYKTNVNHKVIPHHTAKITFTSGSTGTPKGVCLSQTLLDDVSAQLADRLKSLHIKRHVILLPLGILLENIAGIYVPLLLGATIILPEHNHASSMNFQMLITALQHYQPNSLLLTAQGLRALLCVATQSPELVTSLNYVAVGGSKVAPVLLEQAAQHGIAVYEGYGLSECGSVVSVNTPSHHRVGSVGKILFNTSVLIDDDGEIIVSREHLLGYTDSITPPTNIKTGDIGHIDEDGFLFVTGRKKNICINSFGRNFSPEWIEAEAQQYSSIQHLVLFGDAKPFNVAVIQPTTHHHSSVEEDINKLNQQLPDYAQVKYYIIAREAFTPENHLLTANGRPRREQIYKHYLSDIEQFYINEVAI